MPFPHRDAVALSARTRARCSLMRRITRKSRRWSPPSRTAAGSNSGPTRLPPRWHRGLPRRLKSRCRKHGSACLSDHGPCRRRHGDPSGWIKNRFCSANPRWPCANGCARTASHWTPIATSRKTISAPCCCWRRGCAKRSRRRCLASCWPGHLLPWSGRFLSVFVERAAHPFYQALGQLAQATRRSGRRICRSPWRKSRSIANPFTAPVVGAVSLFARLTVTRTYRFCI